MGRSALLEKTQSDASYSADLVTIIPTDRDRREREERDGR